MHAAISRRQRQNGDMHGDTWDFRQQFVFLWIIIFDALDGCSIHDCTSYDTSDSSGSGSTLCDPVTVAGERQNCHRQTRPFSAVTMDTVNLIQVGL